jgi:hypothetical protein
MIREASSSYFGPEKANGGVLSDGGRNSINDLTAGALPLQGTPALVYYGYGNGKD